MFRLRVHQIRKLYRICQQCGQKESISMLTYRTKIETIYLGSILFQTVTCECYREYWKIRTIAIIPDLIFCKKYRPILDYQFSDAIISYTKLHRLAATNSNNKTLTDLKTLIIYVKINVFSYVHWSFKWLRLVDNL